MQQHRFGDFQLYCWLFVLLFEICQSSNRVVESGKIGICWPAEYNEVILGASQRSGLYYVSSRTRCMHKCKKQIILQQIRTPTSATRLCWESKDLSIYTEGIYIYMKGGMRLHTQHVSWCLPGPAGGLHISHNSEVEQTAGQYISVLIYQDW